MPDPAILASHYILAHGPDFVRYGSKPTREIESHPELLGQLTAALRSWEEVLAYPPNQTFIGNLTPDDLAAIPRPWTAHPVAGASPVGSFGRLVARQQAFDGAGGAMQIERLGCSCRFRRRCVGHTGLLKSPGSRAKENGAGALAHDPTP